MTEEKDASKSTKLQGLSLTEQEWNNLKEFYDVLSVRYFFAFQCLSTKFL